MTPKALDRFCRSLPAVTMDIQWGEDQVYKVGGKMFAVLGPSGTVSFKANDVAFQMLVETGAARPAPYMARAKWVYVDDPKTFAAADLRRYLTAAHALVASKLARKRQRELGLLEN
jgi:predicted DNA-binding protein (MmcQ/YjbR family)